MDLSFPNIVPDIFAMISSILSSGTPEKEIYKPEYLEQRKQEANKLL